MLEAGIAEARAGVAQANADLETARLNLGYTEIRSPIDGYVGNRAAQVGAYVANGAYLLSIIPSQGLWVDANFKEDQLAHMRPGQPATVVADVLPGKILQGHVQSLAPGTGAKLAQMLYPIRGARAFHEGKSPELSGAIPAFFPILD